MEECFLSLERVGKSAVVSVCVFRLNDGGSQPRGGVTGVKLGRSNELRVPPAVRSLGKSLHGNTKELLTKKYD